MTRRQALTSAPPDAHGLRHAYAVDEDELYLAHLWPNGVVHATVHRLHARIPQAVRNDPDVCWRPLEK